MKALKARLGGRGDQRGMASMLVTGILVALLSLMVVAFSVLMSRELRKSVENQVGQAAYDAALSGINDVASYVKVNPNTSATHCNDLIGTGKPLASAANLSGDNSTQYTCALVNSKAQDLIYQNIAAYNSQVVQITPSATMTKLQISWQAGTGSASTNPVPVAQAGKLFDETTWSNSNYLPILKVGLYPLGQSQDVSTGVSSRTFYLYPATGTGSGGAISTNSFAAVGLDGSQQTVSCGNAGGGLSGAPAYTCSFILTGLPASNADFYDISLTPIYSSANVQLVGVSGSNVTTFKNTQSIIDVTAQSGSAVKRLQARVDISGTSGTSQTITAGSNDFPQYALQTADTICKRLQVPSTAGWPVYMDNASNANCQSSIAPLSAPTVTTDSNSYGTPYNVQQSGTFYPTYPVDLKGSVNPNGVNVTSCFLRFTWVSPGAGDIPNNANGIQMPCDNTASIGSGTSPIPTTATVAINDISGRYSNIVCGTVWYQFLATNGIGTSYGNINNFVFNPQSGQCTDPSRVNVQTLNPTGTVNFNGQMKTPYDGVQYYYQWYKNGSFTSYSSLALNADYNCSNYVLTFKGAADSQFHVNAALKGRVCINGVWTDANFYNWQTTTLYYRIVGLVPRTNGGSPSNLSTQVCGRDQNGVLLNNGGNPNVLCGNIKSFTVPEGCVTNCGGGGGGGSGSTTFYHDANFSSQMGSTYSSGYNCSSLDSCGMSSGDDNTMSSLQAGGNAVAVYDGAGYTGTCWDFNSDTSYVGDAVNDKMSSFKIGTTCGGVSFALVNLNVTVWYDGPGSGSGCSQPASSGHSYFVCFTYDATQAGGAITCYVTTNSSDAPGSKAGVGSVSNSVTLGWPFDPGGGTVQLQCVGSGGHTATINYPVDSGGGSFNTSG